MPSRIYSPEDPEVVNSNTILKHILKKKYDWVIDVNLVFITVRESRTDRDYNEIVLDGVIKVDKDWYENQWREYNHSFPIPDPNGNRDVVLGELLGSESAMKFNYECRKAITLSLKRQIQGLIWSSLVVRTEEVKKENMTESIRRILREETRPFKVMRRTHLIGYEITRLLSKVYKDERICEIYGDTDMFVRVVTEAVVENLYFNTFYMMDDTSEEWEKSVDFIYDFIKDSYGKKLKDYYNKMCNERVEIDESDPKVGTGKKPKGSGRRLYTDENPSDTVSVKFRTKEDIVDTLNKDSFKSKSHKRQSQIINLIHQRVRAAYQNAKDPETKDRLKRAYDYIETVKEKSKEKTIKLHKGEQNESKSKKVKCSECGWSWKLSEGGHDPYTCHKCGNINSKSELTEKCWLGYTQKGMKTMFGKRYPNCVKKTKK